MPRICQVAGVDLDDPCPKKTLLKKLKHTLDQLEGLRTCPPLAPILHTRAEVCNCGSKVDPYKGKIVKEHPLCTLSGTEAHPQRDVRDVRNDWYPPTVDFKKSVHPYMACYNAPEPQVRACHDCDCRFGIHLDTGNRTRGNHECCYIECEYDKPGFRDWHPKRACNYPNVCKADCFEHFKTSDYFSFEPYFRQNF